MAAGNAGDIVIDFAAQVFVEIGTIQAELRGQAIVLHALRELLAELAKIGIRETSSTHAEDDVQSAGD